MQEEARDLWLTSFTGRLNGPLFKRFTLEGKAPKHFAWGQGTVGSEAP